MSNRKEIIEKIKKLQQMAKSAKEVSTEDEAQAFSTAMQRLMLKHKVTMSEVEHASLDKEDPCDKLSVHENYGRPLKKARILWQESLAKAVCKAHFCRMLVTERSSVLVFVGRLTDLEAAASTFGYMASVAENMADKAYTKAYSVAWKTEGYWERKNALHEMKGFRYSFLLGFAQRLGERYDEELEKMKQEQQGAAGETALIRLTDAMKVVNEWASKNLCIVKANNSSRGISNGAGYDEGKNAANDIKMRGDSAKVSDGRSQKRLS